jgi:hypothetical protein
MMKKYHNQSIWDCNGGDSFFSSKKGNDCKFDNNVSLFYSVFSNVNSLQVGAPTIPSDVT